MELLVARCVPLLCPSSLFFLYLSHITNIGTIPIHRWPLIHIYSSIMHLLFYRMWNSMSLTSCTSCSLTLSLPSFLSWFFVLLSIIFVSFLFLSFSTLGCGFNTTIQTTKKNHCVWESFKASLKRTKKSGGTSAAAAAGWLAGWLILPIWCWRAACATSLMRDRLDK